MAKENKSQEKQNLPVDAADFIRQVIKKMRYRRKVRQEVQEELTSHFEDELKDCVTEEQRQERAGRLIAEFGDVKLLAVLLRRAKKRCRPLWRTVAARTFQAFGVLILCLIIYVVWFFSGKTTISMDYLALLNQKNQPQLKDELNAWLNIEKAIELFAEPNQISKK